MGKIADIKAQVPIEDVVMRYGLECQRNKYRCPFHQDKHPSASIEKGLFHCFTCGKSWDVIDFVKNIEHLSSIKEAVNFLEERYKINSSKTAPMREILKQKRINKQKLEFENRINSILAAKIRSYWRIRNWLGKDIGAFENLPSNSVKKLFKAITETARLEYLFDTINGYNVDVCEWSFIYGTTKDEILQKIKMHKIKI